ncbi:hypothetical protein MNQ98_26980 [Paenibacillus sp. N3/727]|uniref:hypothetical protein n=1 Tax=Paenibacillus sp. N3/727 TaxID=2925845 RepID=UPI001F537B44|nr:hypothetical protein [Paenibacillus sp. N3/727]UNK18016.1 hypothetical protein MNQ98_26980 [Paenibacillus sp. N3/727]
MIIFTSICANYVHKARTLAESVKEIIPDATFVVCLTERELIPQVEYPYFDRIILSKEVWEGNFDRFIFKHTIVEASTAVKGQFFRYLYKEFPNEEKFIYLDPDIYVYSDFTELRALLDTRPIVLCPHLLEPGNIDMELSSTAHGVYNLGFLGVNRSREAQKFIDWWAERLYLYCYDDIANGIFTDQKWIDLAPCFFDVEIFKHRGYNFAPWSLLNCGMSEEDGVFYVKGDPIRFVHFSGYGATAQMCMSKWLPEGEHPFKKMYAKYSEIHDANDSDAISKTIWSYSCYSSGEKIDDAIRIAYRKDYDVMFSVENPFEYSDSYFKKMLNTGQIIKNSKGNFSKVIHVIRTEGIIILCKKVYKKLFNR